MPAEEKTPSDLKSVVSRETLRRIERLVELLLRWQRRINLIGKESIGTIWDRHVRDSVQLALLKPSATRWLDIGSGGGFPGLIIACIIADRPGAIIHLVESNQKKAAFLRHAAIELNLPAIVHARRIEDVLESLPQPEIITARAVAALDALVGYTNLLLKRGAIGLFPKGRDYQRELTEAMKHWHFSYVLHASATDPEARIVELTMAESPHSA